MPEEWLSTREAAAALGMSQTYLATAVREGRIAGELRDGRAWVSANAVAERLADRKKWMTYDEAEAAIGCAGSRITSLVRAGRIVSRAGQVPRSKPSLERRSVERVAVELRREAEANAKRVRAELEQARARAAPPDFNHDWIGTREAAELLGLHPNTVHQLADADRLPWVRAGRRRWFRRDLLELVRAARETAMRGVVPPAR